MKMVFVVNKDLKMGKGKIAAQVAHAALHLTRIYIINKNSPVTVLGATEQQIKELNPAEAIIYDAGRTQVEPGSLTVVAYLVPEDESCFNHLKLL